MTDLLPCPFCGARVDDSDFFVVVECPACGACGPRAQKKDMAEATEAWNRRAPSLFGKPIIETSEFVTGTVVIGDWMQLQSVELPSDVIEIAAVESA